jgi:hypothetical protein
MSAFENEEAVSMRDQFIKFIEQRYENSPTTLIHLEKSGLFVNGSIDENNPVAYISASRVYDFYSQKPLVDIYVKSAYSLDELGSTFLGTPKTAYVVLPRPQFVESPSKHALVDIAWCPLLGEGVMVRPYTRSPVIWRFMGVERVIEWVHRTDGWSYVKDFFARIPRENDLRNFKTEFFKSTFRRDEGDQTEFTTIFRVYVPPISDYQKIDISYRIFLQNFMATAHQGIQQIMQQLPQANAIDPDLEQKATGLAAATPFLVNMTLLPVNENSVEYTEYWSKYLFLKGLAGTGQKDMKKIGEQNRTFTQGIRNQVPGRESHPFARLPQDLIEHINVFLTSVDSSKYFM